MVKFARRSEQVPGVAGRPEQPPKIELKQASLPSPGLDPQAFCSHDVTEMYVCQLLSAFMVRKAIAILSKAYLTHVCAQVNLKREKLELSPVYSTAVDHDGHKLGYIRLVNFGQHAALDMQHAVQKLQACSLLGEVALQHEIQAAASQRARAARLSLLHAGQA